MVLLYPFLFILGFLSGLVYFWHMWKSIGNYGTKKSKVLMSMVVRLPFPIVASLVGYLIGKFEGIIAVLVGFTTFQIIFLVKKGKALKRELEEELKRESEGKKKD
ncbi:MAG: ATP synthase subunit I [Hydrogenothermaceae bacterium]|nr:ATP synthase subunit I [Hydrogenothermaceae bacterium]